MGTAIAIVVGLAVIALVGIALVVPLGLFFDQIWEERKERGGLVRSFLWHVEGPFGGPPH